MLFCMLMLQYRASLASKPTILSAMGEDSKPIAGTSLEFGSGYASTAGGSGEEETGTGIHQLDE